MTKRNGREPAMTNGCYSAEWQSKAALAAMLNDPQAYPDGPDQAAAMRESVAGDRNAALAILRAHRADVVGSTGTILGPYRWIEPDDDNPEGFWEPDAEERIKL